MTVSVKPAKQAPIRPIIEAQHLIWRELVLSSNRRLQFALLLVLQGVPLSLNGLDSTRYGGWPALGFAIALFLVAGPRRVWQVFLLQTVVVSTALSFSYDLSPTATVPASLAVTLPALVTWWALTRGQTSKLHVNLVDTIRYHAVTAGSAALSAVIAGLAVLVFLGPEDALTTFAISFLAALTAQLVVLPLVITTLGRPAAARRPELFVQRTLMLAMTLIVFVPEHALPMTFLIFPPLGWAAIRATRRESHLQLFLVSVLAYALTFQGRGPIAHASEGWSAQTSPTLIYLFIGAVCYLIVPLTLTVEQLFAATSRADRAATTIQRLVDSATQTLFVATDEHGRVTHYSSGAERTLGYRAEEVLGRSPAMFHSEAEITRHAGHYGVPATYESVVLAQAKSGERRDWAFLHRNGTERTASLAVSEITDEAGELIGHIASGEDITERLRAENALAKALSHEQAAVSRLQEVDQVKEELISNVSHELRTPITSISGYTELLIDGALGEINASQLEALERIERNGQRLGLLVEDLLTMSRAESGQLVLEHVTVDLLTVVEDAYVAVEEMIRTRDLDVRLDLPPHPVRLNGDHHALERVAVNLLGNAIKFTPDGGSVVFTLELTEAGPAFVVRDTGLGISKEDQQHLFTRFFRAPDASNRAIQGTGLGLSIVHAIVAQHGGSVTVESEPGQGTTVTALFADDPVTPGRPAVRQVGVA